MFRLLPLCAGRPIYPKASRRLPVEGLEIFVISGQTFTKLPQDPPRRRSMCPLSCRIAPGAIREPQSFHSGQWTSRESHEGHRNEPALAPALQRNHWIVKNALNEIVRFINCFSHRPCGFFGGWVGGAEHNVQRVHRNTHSNAQVGSGVHPLWEECRVFF